VLIFGGVVLNTTQDGATMSNLDKRSSEVFGDYVDRDELAKIFDVNPRTITRWAAEVGGLPHVRLGTRTLYSLASVRTWLAKRERSISRRRAA
jgi:hypothetical protein